jgi:polyisoprenoid-binding protein YceI
MRRPQLVILVLLGLHAGVLSAQHPGSLGVGRGTVTFISSAPHELIRATNTAVSGVLSLDERSFAVRVPMRSFNGFNSPLQKEHFEENYVEAVQFPNALFEGRIIEAADLRTPGRKQVRAKGRFTIHGVQRERIVLCNLTVDRSSSGGTTVRVEGEFNVPLADHDIRVPRIVNQKIASVINVKVDLLFQQMPRP